MPLLRTGRYIITNVKHSSVAFLEDPNEGTPLIANFEQNIDAEKWNVIILENGRYLIQNVANDSYANVGSKAPIGTTIEGRSQPQQWVIQETRVREQFTISTVDSRLLWGMDDGETGTLLELSDLLTDTCNKWSFKAV